MTLPRRTLFILSFVLVILLAGAAVALAALNAPPSADTFTDLNSPGIDVGSLSSSQLWTSMSGDPGGNCTVTNITYLKWDLSSVATTIGSATLTLTRSGGTSNPLNYTVSLHQTGDGWTEGSTWSTAPAPGALIESKSFPAANGDTVVFNSANLVSYLQAQATGDDVASFAVQLTSPGTCSGNVSAVFNSRESTAGPGPNLQLFDPNAVTLANLQATSEEPAANWPLIGGMAVLALALIGLLGYRRMAR